MAKKKRVSVNQFIKAMRQNGYNKGKHSYISYDTDDKTVMSACAFGQAALNLGVLPGDLHDHYSTFIVEDTELSPKSYALQGAYAIWPNVVLMNDTQDLPLNVIADAIEKVAKERKALGKSLGSIYVTVPDTNNNF